jgi:hypothetical protein
MYFFLENSVLMLKTDWFNDFLDRDAFFLLSYGAGNAIAH